MRGRRRKGLSTFAAGAIAILAIILLSYLAATKFANPFSSPFTVHALFQNANGLRPASLVRVAGINVGKVAQIQPVSGCKSGNTVQQQCSAADVTMTISDQGLPLHKDATFAIRPRIFLEGNFFVDISPGSPSAPTAPNGYVFPITNGIEPVQFDQVLTGLQADTRRNLQTLLEEYGLAVKVGGPAYNASIQYWQPAYEYGGAVAHDALGIQPHDLSNWIDKGGQVNGAIDTNPSNLKSLLTDLNTTAGAFARENVNLQNAVAELPKTLSAATPAFNALNTAFPPFRALARNLDAAVPSTSTMIDASLPFFSQLRALVQPSELRGLVSDLSVTVPALAKLSAESIPFMRNQVRPAASCVVNDIIPWSHLQINDQHFNSSNGFPPRPVYVEGVDYLPGLAGESRNFDANGPYIRILLTGGTFTYSLQPGLFGQALAPIDGAQPQLPALHNSRDGAPVAVNRPPLKPNVPCETQPAISEAALNDAPTGTQPQQVSTSLDTPAALARSQGAETEAINSLKSMAKQEGLGFKISKGPGK